MDIIAQWDFSTSVAKWDMAWVIKKQEKKHPGTYDSSMNRALLLQSLSLKDLPCRKGWKQ